MEDEEKILKISVPLYTNQELEEFENTLENNYKSVLNTVCEQVYKERECIGLQMLIKKQQEKLEKQKQQIQDLENTIDRILDEQTEREKYTHELEEKLEERLFHISKRYENGEETLEDLVNDYKHFVLQIKKEDKTIDLDVIELKYYLKIVKILKLQNKIIDAMSEEIFLKRNYSIICKDDIERLKNEIKKEYKNKIKEDPLEMD